MTVFVCGADTKTTRVELAEFKMLEWGAYLVDGHRLSPEAISARWKPLVLELQGIRRKGAKIQDVYPIGYFAGVSLIFSRRCCDAIDKRFPGQCTFLPVEVRKCSGEFLAVWANQVRDDALDLANCDWSKGVGSIINLRKYAFSESKLGGVGIFRLSPNYSGVEDLVTTSFVEFVEDSGFVGFSFWDRATGAVLQFA